MCMLSNNIYDYNNVAQGKITIPGMDDGEEFQLTDVSLIPEEFEIFTHIKMLKIYETSKYSSY